MTNTIEGKLGTVDKIVLGFGAVCAFVLLCGGAYILGNEDRFQDPLAGMGAMAAGMFALLYLFGIATRRI